MSIPQCGIHGLQRVVPPCLFRLNLSTPLFLIEGLAKAMLMPLYKFSIDKCLSFSPLLFSIEFLPVSSQLKIYICSDVFLHLLDAITAFCKLPTPYYLQFLIMNHYAILMNLCLPRNLLSFITRQNVYILLTHDDPRTQYSFRHSLCSVTT